ncbi:MAG: hypothetical protein ACFFCD_15415 [Promethearchaeota archaeon]
MIRAVYLIKNGVCIFNFKVSTIEVEPILFSSFLDAIQSLGQTLLDSMDSINFQNLKLIYTSLNKSTFIATLVDGDEPKEFIQQFLETSKQLLLQYKDIIDQEKIDVVMYKELAPKFTELLLSLPCLYLKKTLIGFKCVTDLKKIDDDYRESFCNCYKMVQCSRFSEFLEKKMERKKYDIIFKLNSLNGYNAENVLDEIETLDLGINITTEAQAILLNLDQDYTVNDFAKVIRENLALDITPAQILEILEEFERHNIVFRT